MALYLRIFALGIYFSYMVTLLLLQRHFLTKVCFSFENALIRDAVVRGPVDASNTRADMQALKPSFRTELLHDWSEL
jgi:hypothetical protein